MRKQRQISCAVTAQLISAFVFATYILQSLYFLNPKFQAAIHLLGLYILVCVGPGRKPRRPVFSQRGSYGIFSEKRTVGIFWHNAAETWIDISSNTADKVMADVAELHRLPWSA